MASEQVLSLRELKPDPANPRRRGERARSLLRRSLQEFGAARSIVVDEAGNIIAGHGTVEAAGEAGITRVRVVDADGSELIAVRRAGLTPEQKQRLGLMDNQTAALAEWDPNAVAELIQNAELVEDIWTQAETDAMLAELITLDDAEGTFERNTLRRLDAGGRDVHLQFGEIMCVIPREFYERVWDWVSRYYPDNYADGVMRLLEAGLNRC